MTKGVLDIGAIQMMAEWTFDSKVVNGVIISIEKDAKIDETITEGLVKAIIQKKMKKLIEKHLDVSKWWHWSTKME